MHFPLEIVKFKKDNQIGKIVGLSYRNGNKIYKIKIAKETYLFAKEEDLFGDHQTFLELN